MVKNAEFERCMDFLARMIEKYGNDVVLPETVNDLQADRSALDAEATIQNTAIPTEKLKIA